MNGGICVVLVNFNASRDTVECLESLLKIPEPDLRIVVCDNGSVDGSTEKLVAWAEGRNGWDAGDVPEEHRSRVFPASPKPVDFTVVRDRTEAFDSDAKVILLPLPVNQGFSFGNNEAIRFADRHLKPDFYWILNNDTIVSEETLPPLLRRASKIGADPFLLGSKLMFYERPDRIQAAGGGILDARFNAKHLGIGESDGPDYAGPLSLDFITCASAFANAAFFEKVGLFDEGYFLYFEDVDLSIRGRKAGARIEFVPDSVLWHKEGTRWFKDAVAEDLENHRRRLFGRTIVFDVISKAIIGYYYNPRNKIYLVRKNRLRPFLSYLLLDVFPWMVRWSILILLCQDHKRVRLGLILRGLLDALTGRMGKTHDPRAWAVRFNGPTRSA